jgi:anaerobic magnesium-protoporphyrin IX monomethyl ester cyclase
MIDAIIISDTGNDTFSASSPLRLQLSGKTALIQNVKNYLNNNGRIVTPVKGENEKNWHCAPKLNGIRLLSYLHARGFNIELIDSYYQERDHFIKMLDDNPKAIIISTTFISNKDDLRELVENIRSVAPDIFIIAGGPFVLSSYLLLQRSNEKDYDVISPKNDFLFLSNDNNPDIDLYIIDKYGEQILSEALDSIKEGNQVNHLPNTAQWNGKKYVFSDQKELSPPDISVEWNNIPEKFFKLSVINIQASTGCPFNCEFCNFVKDRKYNFVKPLDQLVKELKNISDRGVKYIRFVDDNFRLGRNDLNKVCKRFIDEGLDLKWMSFIRASTLERTDFDLLKKAGCVETQIGIESADKEILKSMNKHADPDMYFRAISNLLDVGINCSSCFIVGFPGETEETFKRTIDFIESIPKDSQEGIFCWSIYPFLIVPLSPAYESKRKAKYNLKGYMAGWEHGTMNSEQAYQHIKNAFLKIKNASPIYSGDNLDMLMELPLSRRKEFMKVRHDLSKRFLKDPLDKSLVLSSFAKIFKE